MQPGATLTTTSDNGLLSAAFDPYGYDLTAVSVNAFANVTVTDNSDGSFTYVTDHSTLTVNSDGSFTYTPSAGFSGIDTFTYQANDGLNLSPQTTFTIDVTPSASGVGGSSGDTSGGTDDSSGDVTNPAPQAEDDSYTIAPNQTLLPRSVKACWPTTATRAAFVDRDPGPEPDPRHAQPPERRPVHLHARGELRRARLLHLQGERRQYTSLPATVTITVTSDAPGGTDDGGGVFQGLGLAASNGYGGASGTSGGTNPGNITPRTTWPDPQRPGPRRTGRLRRRISRQWFESRGCPCHRPPRPSMRTPCCERSHQCDGRAQMPRAE